MEKNCVFCGLKAENKIMENEYAFVVEDIYPKTKGHSLIILKRHIADISDIRPVEMVAMFELQIAARNRLLALYPDIKGFNYRTNEGHIAGQTVFHLHTHVIPRYENDGLNKLATQKTEASIH